MQSVNNSNIIDKCWHLHQRKKKKTFVHQKLSVISQSSIKLGCYLIGLKKKTKAKQHYLITRCMHTPLRKKEKRCCLQRLQLPQIELGLKSTIDFPIITTLLFLLSLMFPWHNLRPNVGWVLISLNCSIINPQCNHVAT